MQIILSELLLTAKFKISGVRSYQYGHLLKDYTKSCFGVVQFWA